MYPFPTSGSCFFQKPPLNRVKSKSYEICFGNKPFLRSTERQEKLYLILYYQELCTNHCTKNDLFR